MSDDYGLLHQAAEQDHSSEIPDAFYNNFGRLPAALKAKLSLHDLRCIYEFMVQPTIWVVMYNMSSGEYKTQSDIGMIRIPHKDYKPENDPMQKPSETLVRACEEYQKALTNPSEQIIR